MDEPGLAIERLYRSRYVGYRNAVATVTGSEDSAHDAVQEGFARAFARRRQFRGDAPLAAWVWRIVLRTALESRRNGHAPLLEDAFDPVLPAPDSDPALTLALRSLPPRRRLVVFLRYYADFSYAEIAAACEISEGTVAATLAQAHVALGEALDPKETPDA